MAHHCEVCDYYLQANSGYCDQCGAPISAKYKDLPRYYRKSIQTRNLVLINCLVCTLSMMPLANPFLAVISGPVILAFGMLLVRYGNNTSYPGASKIGVFQCLSCLMFIILSWLTSKSYDMTLLLCFLIIVYLIILFVASMLAWVNHPWLSKYKRFECQHCGYLLFGLKTPRCPECGTEFDPSLLKTFPNPE